MKKLTFLSAFILMSVSLMALPVRNPAMPRLLCEGVVCPGNCCTDLWEFWYNPCYDFCDALRIRFGYSGNFVFDRHMELERDGGGDMRRVELQNNAGLIALNLFDQFDVFGTLGAARVRILSDVSCFGVPFTQDLLIETETHFSWSVGACGTVYEWGCFSIGAEVEYFSSCPDIEKVIAADLFSAYPDQSLILKYREWQVGVGFSYQIHFVIPYIGVKWARAVITMDDAVQFLSNGFGPVTLRDLESKNRTAMAIGASIVASHAISATVEGRFGGEKALYTNLQFQF